MNNVNHPNGVQNRPAFGLPKQLILLVVVLWIEFALLAGVSLFLMYELVAEVPTSYASAVAILVLAVIAAVWLAVLAINAMRARPWVRSGTVVWQILQIAVAVGFFQGEFARPDLAWALLAPAVIAIVLVFSRPVIRAMARHEGDDEQ